MPGVRYNWLRNTPHFCGSNGGNTMDKPQPRLSKAQFDQQYDAAVKRGAMEWEAGRRAVSARYDRGKKRIVMELSNGCIFGFPAATMPALTGMSEAQLARVTVSPAGSGLIWEAEDVDLSVPGLLLSSVGTAEGMRILARKGGRAMSPAKAKAARANGAKGGRPRKKKAA
jgi:hypothetical protein